MDRLRNHCIEAGIRNCQYSKCIEQAKRLEKAVPSCSWNNFRQWVIVAMSCLLQQDAAGLDASLPAMHLRNSLHGCCQQVPRSDTSTESQFQDPFRAQGADGGIGMFEVCEIVYWIYQAGPLTQFRRDPGLASSFIWDSKLLPPKITKRAIFGAYQTLSGVHICQSRLWGLLRASERQQVDLPAIADMVRTLNLDPQRDHGGCTEEFCRYNDVNATAVAQIHKCGLAVSCAQTIFDPAELNDNARNNLPTAWRLTSPPTPSGRAGTYMAVSHVWADGTGVAMKEPGTVNSCLVQHFGQIARQLECDGIWWDTISIPMERKARQQAMRMMHENYRQAKCTLIHDLTLTNLEWKDDGSPCVAVALSPWFTRGWTALELYMSKNVYVLFRGPEGTPLLKNLGTEVLATDYAYAHPAHTLASTVIRRILGRGLMGEWTMTPRDGHFNVHSLLAILQPRVTSWSIDRMVIAGLMAEVVDFNSADTPVEMTQKILKKFGWIKASSLLHEHAMPVTSGPWSWCPPLFYNIRSNSTVEEAEVAVHDDGSATGWWNCFPVTNEYAELLRPYGSQQSVRLRVNMALNDPQGCLLLRPTDGPPDGTQHLLATTVGFEHEHKGPVILCRYTGTVTRPIGEEDFKRWSDGTVAKIKLGADQGRLVVPAQEMLQSYGSAW